MMWRVRLSLLPLVVASLVFPAIADAREGITADLLNLKPWIAGPTMETLQPGTKVDLFARSKARDGSSWYYVGNSDKERWTGWTLSNSVGSESDAPYSVALQVGHWRREEAVYPLNASPGASGGGLTEADLNMITAQAVSRYLSARGVGVELLPTVIPKGYKADAVVAIHADGGPATRRGFFVDRSANTSAASREARLAEAIAGEYGKAISIPYVYRGTNNSRYYYGYYDVSPATPMVLIEAGFLSNDEDRTIMINQSEAAGAAIAEGIMKFLNSR